MRGPHSVVAFPPSAMRPGGNRVTEQQPGVSRRHLFISGGLVATAPLLGAARHAEDISAKGTAAGTATAAGNQAPVEPYLDGDEIQGNVLPGFMKPYMAVAALTIGDVASAKGWLTDVAPRITTLAEAMQSRAKVRAFRGLGAERRNRLGALPPGMNDVWLNIGLSSGGLKKLLSGGKNAGDLGLFVNQGFQRGLAARSSLLGDPTDPAADGHPANWVFGGPGREADVLLILAADAGEDGARGRGKGLTRSARSTSASRTGSRSRECGAASRACPAISSPRGRSTRPACPMPGCTVSPGSTWCGRASSCSAPRAQPPIR